MQLGRCDINVNAETRGIIEQTWEACLEWRKTQEWRRDFIANDYKAPNNRGLPPNVTQDLY